MSKPTVLVLTSTFPRWVGDTLPSFVLELAQSQSAKFDLHILAPHFKGAKTTEKISGITVHRFHYLPQNLELLACNGGILGNLKANPLLALELPFFLASLFFNSLKLASNLKPKLVHAHWLLPQGLIALVIKKLFSIPYIVTSHGSDLTKLSNPFSLFLKKLVLGHAQSITVVSSFLASKIKNFSPVVIPMGVNEKIFFPQPRIKTQTKTILYVGRLSVEKNLHLLINAFQKALLKNPNLKLQIIGDGPEKNNLLKLVTCPNIEFVGPIEKNKLPVYYSSADLCVSVSAHEGLGLTLVEAALCGCPVLGTATGGVKDIILEKQNGYFIKKLTVNSLANQLNSIINLPRLDTRPSTLNRFSWPVVGKIFNQLYEA